MFVPYIVFVSGVPVKWVFAQWFLLNVDKGINFFRWQFDVLYFVFFTCSINWADGPQPPNIKRELWMPLPRYIALILKHFHIGFFKRSFLCYSFEIWANSKHLKSEASYIFLARHSNFFVGLDEQGILYHLHVLLLFLRHHLEKSVFLIQE